MCGLEGQIGLMFKTRSAHYPLVYLALFILKALVNIVFDRLKKTPLKLCWLTCIIMFMWVNKQPRYKK